MFTAITSITIPGSVTDIELEAFYNCDYLENVVFSNGVKNIGESVFGGRSKLTTITIPTSVETIGFAAFEFCNTLTDVYYKGSEEQWKEITIEDNNEYLLEAKIHFAVTPDIEPEITEITIVDGEHISFTTEENILYQRLTYVRTLPNQTWNALYVPFEIPMSEIADNYDVAYINDVHSYDNDNNGSIDELSMEIIKIAEGTLKCNYPYLIRAKNEAAMAMNLTLQDAILQTTIENSVNCSSVFMNFVITGTYSQMAQADNPNILVITTDGGWEKMNEGTSLNPFRLYLTLTELEGSPVKLSPEAEARIRISVKDDKDNETGVVDVKLAPDANTVIYDLMGRRIIVPEKGRIYIVNGKKVIF